MTTKRVFLIALLLSGPACAEEPAIPVALRNHAFLPAEIHVKANAPATIALTNDDPFAEEFDSTALKIEKIVAGKSMGVIRLRPLAPGRYPFIGEYHSDTAHGVVVAE